MKTFNQIITTIIRISLIFLLFFIWVRYYVDSLVLTIIITSVLTLAFDFLLIYLNKKKNIKASLKKEEIAMAEGFCNNFIFNKKTTALNFYFQLLQKEFSPIKKTEFIIFEKNNKNFILFPYYKFNKLNGEDLVYVFNKVKSFDFDKVILCVNDVDANIKEIADKLPAKFIILNKYESYEKLMKKCNIFPSEIFNFNEKTNLKFENFLELSLNKKRASGYIFASIVLLISSFFVKVTIYYLVMSSVLLLLSIFSFINPFYNKKLPESIF
ncbi:MAG: hypothetical protein PHI76_03525 [Clostridia bacterium]|nr:hypothetical protein [Clostridia bacterium]